MKDYGGSCKRLFPLKFYAKIVTKDDKDSMHISAGTSSLRNTKIFPTWRRKKSSLCHSLWGDRMLLHTYEISTKKNKKNQKSRIYWCRSHRLDKRVQVIPCGRHSTKTFFSKKKFRSARNSRSVWGPKYAVLKWTKLFIFIGVARYQFFIYNR